MASLASSVSVWKASSLSRQSVCRGVNCFFIGSFPARPKVFIDISVSGSDSFWVLKDGFYRVFQPGRKTMIFVRYTLLHGLKITMTQDTKEYGAGPKIALFLPVSNPNRGLDKQPNSFPVSKSSTVELSR